MTCFVSSRWFKKDSWHRRHCRLPFPFFFFLILALVHFPVESKCFFNLGLVSKALLHFWHWYFFKPMWWKSMWSVRVEFCQNLLPHLWQGNFSSAATSTLLLLPTNLLVGKARLTKKIFFPNVHLGLKGRKIPILRATERYFTTLFELLCWTLLHKYPLNGNQNWCQLTLWPRILTKLVFARPSCSQHCFYSWNTSYCLLRATSTSA